jgi:DNA-binding PadR family transcriptional regulator
VVLGLLIEQRDHRFSLERRLQERFSSAQFSPTTAYSAVGRLEKEGYVRAVAAGQDRRDGVYEATPEGVEHKRNWVRAPSSTPLLREELHAKIALCEPRDLPRLIETLYSEECACAAELDRIRERTIAEHGSGSPRGLSDAEWSELMEDTVLQGEAAHWDGRVRLLAELRHYLEGLRGEAERRALAEHRRGVAEDRRRA